jgi:hypothetical protein
MTIAFQSTTEEIAIIKHLLRFGTGYDELNHTEQRRRFDSCIAAGDDVFRYLIIVLACEPTLYERIGGTICWKHAYWSEFFHETGLDNKSVLYCIDYTNKRELDFALGFLTDKAIFRSLSYNNATTAPAVLQCFGDWSRRTNRLTEHFKIETIESASDGTTADGVQSLSETVVELPNCDAHVEKKKKRKKKRKTTCAVQ